MVAVGGWQWVAGPIGAVSWSRPWWQGWRCGCSIFRAEILGESSGEVRGHNVPQVVWGQFCCQRVPRWDPSSGFVCHLRPCQAMLQFPFCSQRPAELMEAKSKPHIRAAHPILLLLCYFCIWCSWSELSVLQGCIGARVRLWAIIWRPLMPLCPKSQRPIPEEDRGRTLLGCNRSYFLALGYIVCNKQDKDLLR